MDDGLPQIPSSKPTSKTSVNFKHDEYANLNARAASREAKALVELLATQVSRWELENGTRKYQRSDATAPRFKETLERFVGDLLMAKADEEGTGRLYLSMDKNGFKGDLFPVGYRNFVDVQKALRALGLIEVIPGQGRFKEVKWDKNDVQKWQDKGWATRFFATDALVSVASQEGVTLANIDDHFRMEAPRFPLVLRAGSTYTEGHKHKGVRMEFERAGKALKLEEDLRALNAFLANVEIGNATHYYFIRGFNEGNFEDPYTWMRGGRLYSQGGVHKSSYQQLDEDERAKITLNGKPTCELDLGSCNLTIFHALLDEPLDISTDAYERVLPGQRPLVKSYMTALFGNDGLLDHWPNGIIKRFRKKHGIEPDDIISAHGMGQKVLTAYPAMRHLGQHGARWPDLMHREATTMIHTMQSLMAMGIPSLPIHDGIIVPRDAVGRAVNLLVGYFWRIVGVVPRISAKTAPEEVQRTVAELVASHSSLEPRHPDPQYL